MGLGELPGGSLESAALEVSADGSTCPRSSDLGSAEKGPCSPSRRTPLGEPRRGGIARLECGRISLYSSRQRSIETFACVRFRNHCHPRHSTRNFPSNDSLDPFCPGFPGSIRAASIFPSESQPRMALAANSCPLSDLDSRGAPRRLTSFDNTSITRLDPMRLSTSIAKHSRVNSSTTVRYFGVCPVARASHTKLQARTSFARLGASGRGRPEAARSMHPRRASLARIRARRRSLISVAREL
jgi:hypothetical protein